MPTSHSTAIDHLTIPLGHAHRQVHADVAAMNATRAQRRVDPGARTASETIYLATADSAGNMVSFINSITITSDRASRCPAPDH